MGRFSEDGHQILPDEWQAKCLDFGRLRGALLASAKGQPVPLPTLYLQANQRPAHEPVLRQVLTSDERHRRFAQLMLQELDQALHYLDCERRKCAAELERVETQAGEFMRSIKASSSTGPDPYVRSRLKANLAWLFQEHARHVAFRMVNHSVCQKLILLHSELTEEGKVVGDMEGAPESSLPKELALFVMEHELFSERESGAGEGKHHMAHRLEAEEVLRLYAALFSHGDHEVARTALTYYSMNQVGNPHGFDFGLRVGVFLVLLAWVLWDCLVDDDMGKEVWHDPAFKVYRGLGNLVLLVWCWGINLLVWRRAGVDYERFLRLEPCPPGVDPCLTVWKEGCDLSIAFLLSLICFWKALRGVFFRGVPPQLAHFFPVTLFLYIIYRAFVPWKERKLIYTSIWDVMVAPFGTTQFKEGYVGDILTSVVRVLIDVIFSVLYFMSGVSGWYSSSLHLDEDLIQDTRLFKWIIVPAVTVLPLWWRFMQNLQRSYDSRERWPHLGNALKYATAQTVALYGLFHADARSNPLWIFGFVFATLYQFAWDIFMDWDLIRINQRTGRVNFRETLLYKSKSFYLCIMLVNLGLRFFWTLTLIPEGGHQAWQKTIQVRLSPVLAAAEICRRCMWGFLRLENEHLQVYGTGIQDFSVDEAASMEVDELRPMAVSTSSDLKTKMSTLLASIPSSTSGKSNTMVIVELAALAATIASAGLFVAFAI